jgi:hypothetical protein
MVFLTTSIKPVGAARQHECRKIENHHQDVEKTFARKPVLPLLYLPVVHKTQRWRSRHKCKKACIPHFHDHAPALRLMKQFVPFEHHIPCCRHMAGSSG